MTRQSIVVKIGSNVITRADGSVDAELIGRLCGQIAQLRQQGILTVVVSSGAVAAGRGVLPSQRKADPVIQRQLWAAIGQNYLMQTYTQGFGQHHLTCAQVLVTKEDFRSRRHYLNIRNCLEGMLQNGVVPIINENDVVSVTELMFTDNDELAGLVAAMLNVDKLVILTNVAGLYDRHPKDPEARLITRVDSPHHDYAAGISSEKSDFGRGGMLTKVRMAQKLAAMGVDVYIAGGRQAQVLFSLTAGEPTGTHFPATHKTTGVKRWIGHADSSVRGTVRVNEGARQVLLNHHQATSLLPVGIVSIEGSFKAGDIVALCDSQGKTFGLGKARYGSQQLQEVMGVHDQKPFVHYDYMYLLD